MNFLAHLYLSCDQEGLVVGNFLADFIRNKDVETFPEGVQQGIQLHRKIDTYTDNHPIVRQGVRRFHPYHHKYAPVVIDVLFDYFLAKNWSAYHNQSLEVFTASIYNVLDKHIEIMPQRVQEILPRMIADNWLIGYSKKEGIAYTFSRMKRRVSKPEWLNNVVESLERDEKALNDEFNAFFPDVISYVKEECLCF